MPTEPTDRLWSTDFGRRQTLVGGAAPRRDVVTSFSCGYWLSHCNDAPRSIIPICIDHGNGGVIAKSRFALPPLPCTDFHHLYLEDDPRAPVALRRVLERDVALSRGREEAILATTAHIVL